MLLAVTGCVSRPSPIPSGAYYSPRTKERVTVTPTHLAFDLRIPSDGQVHRVTKVVNYAVLPDNEINTWIYSSGEYASLYGWFVWRWDGSHIIRQAKFPERRPSETVHFHREP